MSEAFLCPICLEQRTEFQRHHVIWSCEGGTDEAINLLDICKSCHALLTFGSSADSIPREYAAIGHQMLSFGIAFIDKSGSKYWQEKVIKAREGIEDIDEEFIDDCIRSMGGYFYIKGLSDLGIVDKMDFIRQAPETYPELLQWIYEQGMAGK